MKIETRIKNAVKAAMQAYMAERDTLFIKNHSKSMHTVDGMNVLLFGSNHFNIGWAEVRIDGDLWIQSLKNKAGNNDLPVDALYGTPVKAYVPKPEPVDPRPTEERIAAILWGKSEEK